MPSRFSERAMPLPMLCCHRRRNIPLLRRRNRQTKVRKVVSNVYYANPQYNGVINYTLNLLLNLSKILRSWTKHCPSLFMTIITSKGPVRSVSLFAYTIDKDNHDDVGSFQLGNVKGSGGETQANGCWQKQWPTRRMFPFCP